MAGIILTSLSYFMDSGDTETDKVEASGFCRTEACTYSASPAGSTYAWSLQKPGSSLTTLSTTGLASGTFTPDRNGTYILRVTVDGVPYTFTIGVTDMPVTARNGMRLQERGDANVNTDGTHAVVYWSRESAAPAVKMPDGTKALISGLSLGTTTGKALEGTHGPLSDAHGTYRRTTVASARGIASAGLAANYSVEVGGSVNAPFYWVPASTDVDAGTEATATICPTDITHPAPGRWKQGGVRTTDSRLPDSSLATGLAGASAGQIFASDGDETGSFGRDVDFNGKAISNFRNGGSLANVPLSTDASTAVATWTATGLGVSTRYQVTFETRVTVWSAAQSGTIDCVIDVVATTDDFGVTTLALATAVNPNKTRLPVDFAPDMTISVATNVLTVYATRPAGVACSAWADYFFHSPKELTA